MLTNVLCGNNYWKLKNLGNGCLMKTLPYQLNSILFSSNGVVDEKHGNMHFCHICQQYNSLTINIFNNLTEMRLFDNNERKKATAQFQFNYVIF